MSSIKVINVEGYWHADASPLEGRCLVMPNDLTDSMTDYALKHIVDSNYVFYIFSSGDRILGEHHSFTITDFTPINEITLGAVQ
jgi:hypothetical protein